MSYQQPTAIVFGITGNVPTSGWAPPGSGANSTTDVVRWPSPRAGAARNLYVRLSTAPGNAKSCSVTVYKNGSPTSLACTISGATQVSNANTSVNVPIANGDEISVGHVTSNGASAKDLIVSMEIV
jgi:hypothetical protein